MRRDVHWRICHSVLHTSNMNRKHPPDIKGKVVRIAPEAEGPKDPRERAFNKAFGARLKAHRKGIGWSQKRLATALQIGVDQYKKYEYGKRSFPLYLLPVLRMITDHSIADWLRGLETPPAISQPKPFH